MKKVYFAFAGLAAAALVSTAQAGTLEDVKANGEVKCVFSTGLAGFAFPDDKGNWTGFDVDFCRATAAADLGDAKKIGPVPATTQNRFTVLNAGEADVLWRNTTITFSRDVGVKLTFLGVNYYEGQALMAKKSLGISSALALDGASLCIQTGTTTELNLADYFRSNNMTYEAVPVADSAEARECYSSGRGDVLTTDASALSSQRAAMENPDDHMVLAEIISKEPLGPAVRQGDDQWADIVRWVLYATITAEELGITQANVNTIGGTTNNPEIKRFLGLEGNQGAELGLSADWAKNIIAQVGNYGEIFERNIGVNTPLGIGRGVNALWTNGGLQYSPPFR